MSDAEAPRSYHHGNLGPALVEAVAAIVEEEGLEAVSLRAAARRAGASPAAAFRHFRDKRDLMTAYAARGFEALAEATAARVAAAGEDPVRRFRAAGEAYLAFALAHPGQFRAMFRAELADPADPRLVAASAALEASLEAGLRAVAPDADAARFRRKSLLAWAVVHGLAALILDGQLEAMLPPGERDAELARTLALMEPVFRAGAGGEGSARS